ncbi:MAG: cytochrome c oxidase subunit II, partial [Dehalococcoidia bacterium]|nr:cytochrome c oxidase subunit II [Dehalococcoidia bacterium]
MNESSFWLPPPKSTLAPSVDGLFDFMLWMSVFLTLLICGAGVYWVFKYRRKAFHEEQLSQPPLHAVWIELFWSIGPLLVCMGLFHWGVKEYISGRVAPANAEEIQVRGRKWAWEFQYKNGVIKDKLYVPVNKPVKLIMQSQDVIHSFFIPDFRIKQDVLPGRYATLWFTATQTGESNVFCAEFCGQSHSNMLSKVIVLDADKYRDQVEDDGTTVTAADGTKQARPPAEVGKLMYT